MGQINFDIPENILVALGSTEAEAGDLIRMAAAVKLFELGRFSSGNAANLAGVSRPVFLVQLAAYGAVTFPPNRSGIVERDPSCLTLSVNENRSDTIPGVRRTQPSRGQVPARMPALHLRQAESHLKTSDGTPARLVYGGEADNLEIFFGDNEPATGVELTDHIILRINRKSGRAI